MLLQKAIKLTPEQKKEQKLAHQKAEEAQRQKHWFETFRLAAIHLSSRSDFPFQDLEMGAKQIANFIEKQRPKEDDAGYLSIGACYAGASGEE